MRYYFFAMASALLLSACSTNQRGNNQAELALEAPPNASAQDKTLSTGSPSSSGSLSYPVPADRMVIYKGRIKLLVTHLDSSAERLRALAARHQAYMADETQTRSEYSSEKTITITFRVPVRQFEPFARATDGIGSEVLEREIQANDVTEEFQDNSSRLRARRAAEQRYLTILSRANTIGDVLKVQEQLDQVREEIERIEGRNQLLSNQAAYSTLTVELVLRVERASNQPPSFGSQLGTAFTNGLGLLKGLAIGLVTIWPLLLVIGVVLAVLWRRRSLRL